MKLLVGLDTNYKQPIQALDQQNIMLMVRSVNLIIVQSTLQKLVQSDLHIIALVCLII